MTEKDASQLVGERLKALIDREDIQRKMLEIANRDGKEAAVKWIYGCVIATLYGKNI